MIKEWTDQTYLMNELVDSEAVLRGELQATDIADARLEKEIN